ncbi:MAG: class I SAM-dependent methyltransferase [Candidatus Thorarchaeota archaeon]|jgi:SAM-dependent methyltransferase
MSDVFGMIMRDALKGEKAEHRTVRDDGYVNEANGLQYLADISEWEHSERLAIREVEGPVLDIGCGAGRVGLYLQKKGIEYTGIDISPLAVETSKLQGLDNVHVMSASSLNMNRNDFKSVIMFGNNFGILGEEEDTVDMLKAFYKITSPTARIFAGSRDVRETDRPEHLAYHKRNRERGWPIGKVTIKIEYQGMETDWWNLLMPLPDEMDTLARKAGWYLEKTIGPSKYYIGVLAKV